MFRLWYILSLLWIVGSVASARPAPLPDTGALRTVRPQSDDPTSSALEWEHFDAGGVHVYALPGTAAARELPQIGAEVRASLARVERRLGLQAQDTLEIYLVERIFWQGGAAYGSGQVLISYPDRGYVGIPLQLYLDHEITHVVAHQLVPPDAGLNLLLVEGLAVWAAGGHYGVEPYHQMATAIAQSDEYIPLHRLLRSFRRERHEVAYIEAGSFVGWLIDTRGLPAVRRLYANPDAPERVLGQSYAELEREWRTMLALQPVEYQTARRFALQARSFEALREYQRLFDPLARDIPDSPSSWSPEDREQYQDNIDAPVNVALETMLVQVQLDLRCGRLAEADRRLNEIERSVDAASLQGAELEMRRAIADVLSRQSADLERGDVAAYVQTAAPSEREMIRRTLEQFLSGAGLQETARIEMTAGSKRANALVWWRSQQNGTEQPLELEFEADNGQWQLVNVREVNVRSQHQCNASPMVSTI